MKFDREILASRVGRRLLLLFVLAALAPIVSLVAIVYGHASASIEQARQEELTQSAKSYGMQLIERLVRADRLLDTIVADVAAGRPLPQHLSPSLALEFDAVGVVSVEGERLSQIGTLPLGWHLDQKALAELTRGRTVLREVPASAQLVLIRRVEGVAGGARLLAASTNLHSLWGSAETYPPMTDFCVFTTGGQRLFCSRPADALDMTFVQNVDGGASPPLSWPSGDEVMRGSAWSLFVESRFAAKDWIVVAMQPEQHALRTLHSLRAALFPVAALALVAICWVSMRQIRRILVPLQDLLAGTSRVASRDFDAKIRVGGNDEFARLAGAFNTMTDQLGAHFRTLTALTEIDRTILTSLDLRRVAESAAHCVQQAAPVDVVVIGLLEPDAPGRMRLHTLSRGDPRLADAVEFEWSAALKAAAADAVAGNVAAMPPIDAQLAARGMLRVRVVPVRRGGQMLGLVVLGAKADLPIDEAAGALIAGVVDRLAVALASATRDKQLQDQAHFDVLTNLPNRYYLMNLLAQALAQARRSQQRLAVLFVDLDNFKRTNDTLGHASGDRVLQDAASRIRAAVRASDIVARLGGDEFTVVLTDLDDASVADGVATKLIDVLTEPFEVEGLSMYLGASIGIAMFPADGADGDQLLRQADTAMYRAKSEGRGRYAFFEPRMNTEANERARIDRELRQALQRDELLLHYQPQIDLRSGRLCGVEALVRWQHPERGLLAPGTFVPVAEESGLIENIGAWVLDEACAQLARWRSAGIEVPLVAVNVSSRQLLRPDFVALVREALARHGVASSSLELEVTESLFTESKAVEALRQLQADGLEIAVDDFGVGYSSFAYLRSLPFSILKIDRTFLADVANSREAATIAEAIINMAHALSKQVVAEGVETAAQIEFLSGTRCQRMQGYAISRPLAPDAFVAYYHAQSRGQALAA